MRVRGYERVGGNDTIASQGHRRPGFGGLVLAAAVLGAAALSAAPAAAHSFALGFGDVGFGDVGSGGFLAGLRHPPSGFDHLLAMVSVGIWGAELGAPAIWLLPVAFPLIMAVGGALGVVGAPLPGGEFLIALSVIVLGAAVAAARRVPIWAAIAVAGGFAVAHGHAHGVELPRSGDALAFTFGFVLATGLLHLAGILVGLLTRWPRGLLAIRAGGAMIAVAGCYFLYASAGA